MFFVNRKEKKNQPDCRHDCASRENVIKSVKIEKYQDLTQELKKIGNIKVRIMSLTAGEVGTLPKTNVLTLDEVESKRRIVTV